MRIELGKLMALPYGEITEEIIGPACEVYRLLRYGFLEKVYQKAMQVELLERGLKAEFEHQIKVNYKRRLWVITRPIFLLKKSRWSS